MNTQPPDNSDAELPSPLRDALRRLARPELPPGLRHRLLAAVVTESAYAQAAPVRRVFVSDDTQNNTRRRYWRAEAGPVSPVVAQPVPMGVPFESGPRSIRRVVSISVFGPNK